MRQNSNGQNLNIRTSLGPQAVTRALVREIHALDANLAPGEVITMREQVERTTAVQRMSVSMLGVFGGLALVLAAVGLYGVMSYTVSQSTRELGLRMALGADASNLLRLVMSQGLVLTAGGVVLGATAALALTRLLGNLLYRMSLNAVSKHVKKLESAGLIRREIRGREHFCQLDAARFESAIVWMSRYRKFWTDRMDVLEKHLIEKRRRAKQ